MEIIRAIITATITIKEGGIDEFRLVHQTIRGKNFVFKLFLFFIFKPSYEKTNS